MRLWLDDVRPAPVDGKEPWVVVPTASAAIEVLRRGYVTEISLDHDLGEVTEDESDEQHPGTGYDVAMWIEEAAARGDLKRLSWRVHSSNTPGRLRMSAALLSAQRFWDRNEGKLKWGGGDP